jgi:hypothetical protein
MDYCHKEAKNQVDEFISDYKDMPNRVYTLISGRYHLNSTGNLHDMQKYMYRSLQETIANWEEDEVLESTRPAKYEDDSLFNMTFGAFGDLQLLITHNINLDKPIHLNITGNNYMKSVTRDFVGPCVFNCTDCSLPLDGFYHPVINASSEVLLERMEQVPEGTFQ